MKALRVDEREDGPLFPAPGVATHSETRSVPFLLRRSELVLLGYFVYAAAAGFCLPVPIETAVFAAIVNLTLITAFLLVGHAHRSHPSSALAVLRDWAPVALVLLAYREMGWFAPAEHTYELEQGWIVWDRMLLNDWGFRGVVESFGPLIPSILEISYALVYTVGPFSVGVLYFYGRRASVNRFLFTYLLGTLLSYCLFPYFPSEPPRAVFVGEDVALDNIFRQFNWWLLGGHGIHTSVFPSAHVSSAFAAAFGLLRVMPDRPWPGRLMLVLACLIFTATVYGRYHYFVDGLAGVAVSLMALGITHWVERRTE